MYFISVYKMAPKKSLGDIFVLMFTDFLYLKDLNSSADYVVEIFDNGYLFQFTSLPSYFLSKLVLEDRGIFFLCSI